MSDSLFLTYHSEGTVCLRDSEDICTTKNVLLRCTVPVARFSVAGAAAYNDDYTITVTRKSVIVNFGTFRLDEVSLHKLERLRVVELHQQTWPVRFCSELGTCMGMLVFVIALLGGLGAACFAVAHSLQYYDHLEHVVNCTTALASVVVDSLFSRPIVLPSKVRPRFYSLRSGNVMIQEDVLCSVPSKGDKDCVWLRDCALVTKSGHLVFGQSVWTHDNCTVAVSPIGVVYMLRPDHTIEHQSKVMCAHQFQDITYKQGKLHMNCNEAKSV